MAVPKLRVPFEITAGQFKSLQQRVGELTDPAFWVTLGQGGLVDLTGGVADSAVVNGLNVGEAEGLMPAETDYATRFNGTDQSVQTPYEAWVPGGDITLMALLNIEEVRDFNGIFGTVTPAAHTTGLYGAADGSMKWAVDGTVASFAGGHVAGAQFLTLVFSDSANLASLYIDGELVEQVTQSASVKADDDFLTIGYAVGNVMLGRIEHVIAVEGVVEPAVIRSLSAVFLGDREVVVPAKARTVEQDSKDEIAQCLFAIFATQPGDRTELPEFGLASQLFRMGGVDLDELREAVEEWEPRADVLTETEFEGLAQRVKVTV